MELPRAIRRGRSRVETRPSTRAALACDVLEGRRLMTAGAAHAKADLARLARDGEVFHIDTRVSAAEINAVEADSTAIRAATTSLASPSATHALLADLSSGSRGHREQCRVGSVRGGLPGDPGVGGGQRSEPGEPRRDRPAGRHHVRRPDHATTREAGAGRARGRRRPGRHRLADRTRVRSHGGRPSVGPPRFEVDRSAAAPRWAIQFRPSARPIPSRRMIWRAFTASPLSIFE